LKIGVISDTHGLFDPAIPSVFAGVEAIIHAGDIGKLEVIRLLEQIAPVLAVEGNNDWFGTFPTERLERIAGRRIMVRHIFGELHQLDAFDMTLIEQVRPDVLVFGHSHRPYSERLGQTLLLNPGSAGPRRFSLPRTVGLLVLEDREVRAQIIDLERSELTNEATTK
jgi:uncharacterized protein